MIDTTKKGSPWKLAFYLLGIFIGLPVLLAIGVFVLEGDDEKTAYEQPSKQVEHQENDVAIPSYVVLDKTEHISTRMSDDQASYFGDVLIEEGLMSIPPDEFTEIAREIAKQEGLDYSASFYMTKESYEVNVGRIISEEDRDLFGEEMYENDTIFLPQEEVDELLDEGYLGKLENGEFTMSSSSTYYKQHQGDSDI